MGIELGNINANRSDGPKRNDNKSVNANTQTPAQNATPTEGATSANVSLSSSAQNLAKIEAELKSLPEINQSRVDEVKARIERGEYHPDSENLAQKMLNME